MKNPLLKLIVEKGLEFGSRATNCHKNTSDYDIAIMRTDLEEILNAYYIREEEFKEFEINYKKYFQNYPKGTAKFYCKIEFHTEPEKLGFFKKKFKYSTEKLDLYVLDEYEDMAILNAVMEDLKKVPNYILESKELRVKLFSIAASKYGWNPQKVPF